MGTHRHSQCTGGRGEEEEIRKWETKEESNDNEDTGDEEETRDSSYDDEISFKEKTGGRGEEEEIRKWETREESNDKRDQEEFHLPNELWTNIIKKVLVEDPSSKFTISKVSKLFKSITDLVSTNLLKLHIIDFILTKNPVSVRHLSKIYGPRSGLIIEIRRIIKNKHLVAFDRVRS